MDVIGRHETNNWWAHQDSNLGPMDSRPLPWIFRGKRRPIVSNRRGLSHHPIYWVRDALACI